MLPKELKFGQLESSLESFGDWIRTHQWESAMCNYSSNEKLEYFTQVIHDKIEYYFLKRTAKFHVKDKPFVTGNIKNLIITRDRAFRNIDKERYRFLRYKVTEEIRKEKRIYYNKKIKPLRNNDSKSWWNAVKKLAYSKNSLKT